MNWCNNVKLPQKALFLNTSYVPNDRMKYGNYKKKYCSVFFTEVKKLSVHYEYQVI